MTSTADGFTTADVDALEAQMRQLRHRREAAARRSQDTATLRLALLAVERDIDAGTSPKVEALRATITTHEDALRAVWVAAANMTRHRDRLAAAGYPARRVCDPQTARQLDDALQAIADLQAAADRSR